MRRTDSKEATTEHRRGRLGIAAVARQETECDDPSVEGDDSLGVAPPRPSKR